MARFQPTPEQIEQRTNIGRWQIVTVSFTVFNVDTLVQHSLPVPKPEQIYYQQLRSTVPCSIYHNGGVTRKPWGPDFLYLRCDVVPATVDILLTVAPEPLDQRPIPLGNWLQGAVDAGTLDGFDSTYFLNASNLASGQVALARGGTGASLADPGADRLLFWDDSGTTVDWLTAGTGLSITGTTLSVTGAGATGQLSLTPTTHTIADDGAGTAPSSTLTPTSSYVKITNNDPDGATLTLGESGISDGQLLTIVNVGTNTVTLNDSAGVQEIAGTFVMGQWDTMQFIYVTDRWVEVGRSDN